MTERNRTLQGSQSLRKVKTMTISQLKAYFHKGHANAYAWPGGYPVFFLCSDGGCLCPSCVTKNRRQIFRATHEWHNRSRQFYHTPNCGWALEAADINWEDASLYCDNCNNRIESAYAED